MAVTVGQMLINRVLPPDLQDYNRILDAKGTEDLFKQIAERYPERYRDISKQLSDIGRHVVTTTGGYTFRLQDFKTPMAVRAYRDQINADIRHVLEDEQLTDTEKDEAITKLLDSRQKPLEAVAYNEAEKADSPFVYHIRSGARGKKAQLKSLIAGDLMYVDHHQRPIPLAVTRSYSEGLTPSQYWAGTFGARKGTMDTKFATQNAGAFGKQLKQVSHRLVIVGDDDEEDIATPTMPRTPRGMPTNTDDTDNIGSLLAHDAGGYKRNTVLTARTLEDLQARGVKRILVRSPTVGGPASGVYARDAGIRERGGLSPRGDFVGVAAAHAISERLTQGQLNSKHSGGVAGADRAVSGFQYLNQLIQAPKIMRGGATHAQLDGRIERIEDAPQGGKYIYVGGSKHYTRVGFDPLVKVGDEVEAGDVLSDGIPNPAEITRHKGIGEGRRYFTSEFTKACRESGLSVERRNVELVARGLLNHVELTDELNEHVSGDVIPYTALERSWKPREDSFTVNPKEAVGAYLDQPVLHYTIGDKIKPNMLRQFEEFGVDSVQVNKNPPPFRPTMIRSMGSLAKDPDWVTRHLGSNLQSSTLDALHHNLKSDPYGTSYVPAAVLNPLGFGREGHTKAWRPKTDAPIKRHTPVGSILDGI